MTHRTAMVLWEDICILCGELISNFDSVTFEHIIPASKGGDNKSNNIAVSHYQCNQVRENRSLIEGIRLVQRKREKLGNNFPSFINQSVPNRFHLKNKRKCKKHSAQKESYCEDFQI